MCLVLSDPIDGVSSGYARLPYAVVRGSIWQRPYIGITDGVFEPIALTSTPGASSLIVLPKLVNDTEGNPIGTFTTAVNGIRAEDTVTLYFVDPDTAIGSPLSAMTPDAAQLFTVQVSITSATPVEWFTYIGNPLPNNDEYTILEYDSYMLTDHRLTPSGKTVDRLMTYQVVLCLLYTSPSPRDS